MSRERRICFYPVFTESEAGALVQEASRYGITVSDLIRNKFNLDKLPDTPSMPVGRPPLSDEERDARAAVREAESDARAARRLAMTEFVRRLRAAVKLGAVSREARHKDRGDAAKELIARARPEDLNDARWDWLTKTLGKTRDQGAPKERRERAEAELVDWRATRKGGAS